MFEVGASGNGTSRMRQHGCQRRMGQRAVALSVVSVSLRASVRAIWFIRVGAPLPPLPCAKLRDVS